MVLAFDAPLPRRLGETATHWIVHSFTEIDYLETYAANPSDIYGASSIDDAAKNTFTQARKFLMAKYDLTDDEATTYITQAVDFGMTQLVDGNWGMQAEIPKAVFEEALGTDAAPGAAADLGPPDLALSNATVHWGYFSKNEAPVLTVADGAEVVVEMATHHACDDWDKMIKDDPGMESVFAWDTHTKRESFRGATGGGDCQCINQIVAARPPLLNHWQATHWLICAQATACTCSRARSSSRGPSPAIY